MKYNTDIFQTAVEFLGQVAGQDVISNQLQSGIQGGSVVLKPSEHFVRKDMSSAAGITHLVDNTTEARQGISTIDKGRLPTSEAFIATELAIKLGVGKTAGGTAYDKKANPALRNAELEIMQGGRNVLSIPVASLINEYTGSKVSDDFHVLNGLVYLGDDREFTVSLKYPSGEAMPDENDGDKQYVEIRMRGFKTAKRL